MEFAGEANLEEERHRGCHQSAGRGHPEEEFRPRASIARCVNSASCVVRVWDHIVVWCHRAAQRLSRAARSLGSEGTLIGNPATRS